MMFETFGFVLLTLFVQGPRAFGEQILLPVESSQALRLAQIAILTINRQLQGQSNELVEVARAAAQVEDYSYNSNVTLRIKDGLISTLCEVNILEQPSLKKTRVTHLGCTEDENEERRMFDEFINKYNKVYVGKSEYLKRFQIFKNNLKKIESLRENERGTAQYGITQFADFSPEEFEKYLGLKKPNDEGKYPEAEIPDIELPKEFDWRDYNVVTGVKNQGVCGSCWAFSAVGNVEGQWALKHKKLYSLSEQELVDCDEYDFGCSGGWPSVAFRSIIKLGGLETETDYPYSFKEDKCNFNSSKIKVTLKYAVSITSDETQMAQWLVANGPISVSLNAKYLMMYTEGVLHPNSCDPRNLDHAVLIVGYGVEGFSSTPYWIVKNSWGSSWGEKGYFRLYRGDGTCGINAEPVSSVVT